MKGRYAGGLLILALVALGLGFSSCNGLLSSLSFYAADSEDLLNPIASLLTVPSRREYPQGAAFSLEDLKVFVVYADGSTREIPIDEVTVTGIDDFDTPGEKTITVIYGGKTAKFTVTVLAPGDPGSETGDTSIELVIIW
jgi:hypothetical protein